MSDPARTSQPATDPKASNGSATVLKRALRPLRPLLLPIWRGLRTVVSYRPARRSRRAADGIRALRRSEIADLAAMHPYYRRRRRYLHVASRVANEMIARRHLRTGLELGPHQRSLIVGADTIELEANPGLQAEGRRFVHDATVTPWPLADRSYDLFVALQVFEHLGDRQREAFTEVRRVARHAMISLPIDWTLADPTDIHHRISREQVLAWFAPVVPSRIVVGNDGPRTRLIFVFEDLPAPDAPA